MFTDLVADGDGRMLVALVAGATRGAGRAIAVELARAGFFVYATGRSSRATGPSEIGRPEMIEETGDLIRAAGGAGAARVVDHEDPSQVAALVAAIDDERSRLDVLVNDIFGATGTCSGTSRCGSTTGRAGYGPWRVAEDDPDSDLYAESSDAGTVMGYITAHARESA